MRREIKTIGCHIEQMPIDVQDVKIWVSNHMVDNDILFAHALDGVIWGHIYDDMIRIGHEVAPRYSPVLDERTLLQLRLFNEAREIRLWRNDVGAWQAIHISDVQDEDASAIDEQQLLWGTHAKVLDYGFAKLEDGAQGLIHVLPAISGMEFGKLGLRSEQLIQRAYVQVRHYLVEDGIGVNSIGISRYMTLGVQSYGQR